MKADIDMFTEHFRQADPNFNSLRDWYPPILRALPLDEARLVCQLSTITWNRAQQRLSGGIFLILAILYGVVLYALAIACQNVDVAVMVLATSIPLAIVFSRIFVEHRESAQAYARIEKYAEKLWEHVVTGAVSPDKLRVECRSIQDELFARQCQRPLVFNWVYKILRGGYNTRMGKTAEDYVAQWQKQRSGHP